MPISRIGEDYIIAPYRPDNMGSFSKVTPNPAPKDTMAPAPNADPRALAEAELKRQIEEQKAAYRKQREELEAASSQLTENYNNLSFWDRVAQSIPYAVQKLALEIQIKGLAIAEKISPAELLAAMKEEIDKFVVDFENASKGDPDRTVKNPFDPNAPGITPSIPTIDAKGNAKISGGGPSLFGTLFDGLKLGAKLAQLFFTALFK